MPTFSRVAIGLFEIALFAGCYFLPSIVAFRDRRLNAGAILLLNAAFGWTVLGWLAAFVWALTRPAAPRRGIAL